MKKILFLAMLLAFTQANAAVIDFESVSTGDCQVSNGGSVDGFTLSSLSGPTGAGFNNASACSFLVPSAHSGSQFMLNWNSRYGTFSKDAGTFTLNSLYVHADSRVSGSTVRFIGLDAVGGNVLFSEDVLLGGSWQHVIFSNWVGVKSFTWDSITPDVSNISIDDFEYNAAAVPEPTTIALLGLGLLGFAAARRRKQ